MTWRAFMYPKALANLFGGSSSGDAYQMDWLSDTINGVALDSGYAPSDAHEFYADISGDEIVAIATDHPTGGQTMSGKTITYPISGVTLATCSGLALQGHDPGVDAGEDVRWLAIYDDTVSGDPLLGYVDFNKLLLTAPNTLNTWALAQSVVFQFHAPQTGQCRWFGKAIANALGGEASGEDRRTDYLSDTIKVALLDNSYVPSLDTNEQWSTISGDEVSGTGYTAGGVTLTTKALTLSGKTLSFGADDPTWAALTLTSVRWAVAYNDTNADKPLLWLYDLQADYAPAAEPLTLHLSGGHLATLRCV